jgi:hypothetical protein
MRRTIAALIALALAPSFAQAGETPTAVPPVKDLPVFVATVPNPHDYSLFANNGWDGNWYVGYNTCWIKKLPPVPAGKYARAYIGAKLGRMKLNSDPRNAWNKEPIPGSVYIGLSSTSSWTRDHSFTLTSTEEIPLEGDSEMAVENTGESQWFWVEVPLSMVNFQSDNFLALWSPTPELISVSSAPVLAAAWGGKTRDTWLPRDVEGAPPRNPPMTPETAISYFTPALALKLIPATGPHSLRVMFGDWVEGTPNHPKPVATARVEGEAVEAVWLEYNAGGNWQKTGRRVRTPPFSISIDQAKLPPGRIQLRFAAVNNWEDRAVSPPFTVEVSTSPTIVR